MTVPRFRKIVWAHYAKYGRHDLPWRKTRDPYRILVSEIMLQQTQVKRVLPFYAEFMRHFPTTPALAKAPLSDVLKVWQGLGYNRRAKMLREAAIKIARGGVPRTVTGLEALPGVGTYTARALQAFAYDKDVVFVETNIRTAILHHFFANEKSVNDAEIAKVLARVLPKGRAREWYYGLMDYGASLKLAGIRLNAKSNRYRAQATFKGSDREARGAIVRELSKGRRESDVLASLLGPKRRSQVRRALDTLIGEGLIKKRGKVFTLPQ